MKCPTCRSQNPDSAKFCVECGNKFEVSCPACGFGNSPSFRFCAECGQNLSQGTKPATKEFSFDEKLRKIKRYLPKGLTEKILSQRDRIEGERKQVTIMFCDMVGFTPLAEKLDPEETYGIIDRIYEILIHKVHGYEGTVNEMTGDGIMALFGAHIALEDAPQRAIRSALAIHREISRFSNQLKSEKPGSPSIKMRIGIHTGQVVVGTVGNDLRVEFTAVGDAVNLASRMEGLAEPGTVYVTGETYNLTEGFFRFENLGKRQVKGRDQPVGVYRVISANAWRTRFDVSAERGLTPFVGRARELELLLDGFNRAKDGKGQVYTIVAEAGLGKSRLLYEFRKAVSSEDVTFLEGKCLSYSKAVAYYPVIDLLKSNFEIHDSDSDEIIIKKVKKGLKSIEAKEDNTLPYLLDLLSVRNSGIEEISMSPEARKIRINGAVERITLKGSEIRPLIIAIEDLHWIDKRSETYFKDLLDHISNSKILLIFTYRPEFIQSWGTKSYYNQINLTRLSEIESSEIAAFILKSPKLDDKINEIILERTDGVPFFIEELIKSLKDMNLIENKNNKYTISKSFREVCVPSTIQDIIMARVDSLPDGAKELLQIGSVIEREFDYELIKEVAENAEEILIKKLDCLKDSELIYERGIIPESTYIFKHALTRDVIYESILSRKKKQLHEVIGNAIESIYKDNISEYYGVLVNHFLESENYEKGAIYSNLAGNKAEISASFPDAISYAKKRISCLERLPITEEIQKEIIKARTRLGYYYIRMDYFADAKGPVDPIYDLAIENYYRTELVQIKSIIGIYKWSVEEDFSEAINYLNDALKISKELTDIKFSRFPNYWLGVAYSFMCKFENALYHFQKALDVSSKNKTLWDISVVKSCMGYFIYTHQGKIDVAHHLCGEALKTAKETGDVFPKAFSYANYGVACYGKGIFQEAVANMIKGINFSEKIEIFTWSAFTHFNLGELFFDIGEYDKSLHHYNVSIKLMKKNRTMPSWVNLNKLCIAKTQVLKDSTGIDLEALYKIEFENKIELYSGLINRSIGVVLLNIDEQRTHEAEGWIIKAIEKDSENEMLWHLGKDYALYADFWLQIGDLLKFKETINKAIEIFKGCGSDGWAEKYEKKLSMHS